MMAIKKELTGWCPTDIEIQVYEVWAAHKILPFAGGWLDQPEWVYELFRKHGLLDELVRLNNNLRSKKE